MMEACHFKMPAEMARKIIEIARDRDVSVGQIIRDLIAQEVERAGQGMSPLTPEQRRFEALRVDLAPEFRESPSWQAMQSRLRAKGYELRLAGSALALHSYPKGHRVCLAVDLGLSHGDLATRLGEAFPGHPDRLTLPRPPQQPSARTDLAMTPVPAVAPPPAYTPATAPAPGTDPWPDHDPAPIERAPHVSSAPNGLHLAEPAHPTGRRAQPAPSYPQEGRHHPGSAEPTFPAPSRPSPATPQAHAQAHARAHARALAQSQALADAQALARQHAQDQAEEQARESASRRQDPRLPPSWLTHQRETA